jgi:nucleotide-binding universal stress UspA family protein
MESIMTLIKAYLGTIEERMKNKGLHIRSEVRVGTAADEIIKAADEINATIVAMSTHARSGLTRWAFGNVPDQVLHGGHHPMLLVRYQIP